MHRYMHDLKHFSYSNVETKLHDGMKTVRKVFVKRGKGYKSVTHYMKGKRTFNVKKPIHIGHIVKIKVGKFIPKLFADCKNCTRKKK